MQHCSKNVPQNKKWPLDEFSVCERTKIKKKSKERPVLWNVKVCGS
jgi:hypothetical protein